jgi:predicted dehydrogenase
MVGAGTKGEDNLKAFGLLPDVVEIAGISELNPDRAAEIAARYGVRVFESTEALVTSDDVDLVNIVTSPLNNASVARDALAAGKHVLCEKPLAMTAAEGEELLGMAQDAGVQHAVSHQRRYDPVHIYLRELIADGYVGEPTMVHAAAMAGWIMDYSVMPGWVGDPVRAGGVVLQNLVHIYDLVRFILGPMSVESIVTGQVIPAPDDYEGTVVEDSAVMAGRLAGGALATVSGNWSLAVPTGMLWAIYGTGGTLVVDGQLRVHGAQAGDTLAQLPVPERVIPAVALEGTREPRESLYWEDNRFLTAALVAEMAGVLRGELDDPLYATFEDAIAFAREVEHAGPVTSSPLRKNGG